MHRLRRVRSIAALVAVVASTAILRAAEPPPAPAGAVAVLDGQTISRQELDARVVEQLIARQPDVLQQALEQMIQERLLDLEAARLGISREALLAREVSAKLAPVTDADVDRFYEEKKAQIGAPKDQILPQIRSYLETQRQQAALGTYVEGLRGRHAVRNVLAEQQAVEEAKAALSRRAIIEGGDGVSSGPADAAVTLVEFTDFQCPFCKQAAPAIESVRRNYGDRVRIVLHQLPLTSIHPHAQKAAEAALCAQDQGKFWEMHDLLFGEQDRLEVADLKDKARRVGLDGDTFDVCLDAGKMVPKVAAELAIAERIDLNRTPTVFVNGRAVKANDYPNLSKEIDAELARGKK